MIGLAVGIIASVLGYTWRYRHIMSPTACDASCDATPLREVVRYSFQTMLAMNIGLLLSQVDMQLIIVFLGTREAGYYANYLGLIGIPFIFLTPLIQFVFPLVSHMDPLRDHDQIAKMKSKAYDFLIVFGMYTMVFFLILGPMLGSMLFGETFRYSGEMLRWSTPFIIFNFLLQINFQILAGTGMAGKRVKILALGILVNLLLSVVMLMGTDFGGRGIALAVGAAWVPIFFLSARETRGFVWTPDRDFLIVNGLASVVLAGTIYALVHLVLPATRLAESAFVLTMGVLSIILLGILNRKTLRKALSHYRQHAR